MSSVQKKTTRTTKTVTTKTTQQVQTSSVDQSDNVQSSVSHNVNNLSIVKKGQFFNDSYFEDTRQDFQDAVQDVLAKWGDKSKPSNDINSYRELRARDLRDENQAIKSTEDQRYHKIVVDVQDFINGGEVSVKTLDEEEIVVEGRVERKVGNTRSTKSFKRTFIFSDMVPESITSVVSADGILIIKALKKDSEMDVSESVTVQKTVVKQQQQQQTSTVQTSGQQAITVASPQPEQEQTVSVTKQITSTTTSDTRGRQLPIDRRGGFFEDAYFEDCRQHFQKAVKQVLQKCNVTSTQTDDLTTYRDLRQRDLREENQVATVDDEEQFQKIIVDVKDFLNGGEVTVKTVEEREVVIEGRVERQEGNKKTTKRFCKRFILPEDILVESVTSVVSSDGVLTVTAPRKPSETRDTDVNQSVTVQKTVVKKQQTSTVETSGQQDVKQIDVQVKETDTTDKQTVTDTQQTKAVTTKTTKTVTVTTTKSSFFNETTFVEDVKDFQEAITTIIKKLNLTVTEDVFSTYRNYRKNNPPKNENQAVSEKETDTTKKIVMDVSDFLENVTVKVVERELVVEGHGKRQTETGAIQTFNFTRRFCLPEDVNPDDITAVISSEGILIITIIRRKTVKVIQKKDITDVKETDTKKDETQVTKTTTTTTKTVTITTTKSSFFNETTFVEDVKDFQEAITTIIKKLNLTVTEDVFSTYRNYRKNNPPKNENQAVSEKETDTTKKIVIDVCDFIGGVTVKVDDRLLIVEGKGNRHTEGGGVQTFSFNRQFCLPDDVNPDDISAVLTSEGVLIITIIRKKTVTSVVTKEETVDKSSVTQVKKETTEVKEVDTKKTTSTDEPKKTAPVEEPKKITPTEEPKTTPVEEPKKITLTEEPKTTPVEEPKKTTPTEEPKTTPVEEPKKTTLTEEPKTTPVEEPKKITPTEAPKTTPVEEPKKITPTEEPKTTPVEEPKKITPTEEPKTTPVEEPKKITPSEEPTKITPAEEQKTTPKEEPKTTPTEEPKTTPTDEPKKTTPVEEPKKITPAEEPKKTTPAEEPKTTPADEPKKTTPTDEPKKAAPKEELETTPADEPKKATPREEPKTTPTDEPKTTPTDVAKTTTTEKDETQLTKTTTTTTKTTKTVTVTTTKSTFFQEPTFVEDVKDFQEAITTIIKKLNLTVTEDVFTTYRNYRKNNPPKNENQAVSEKETDTTKKIVMDVSDFLENVTVRVVERELVVEGQGKRPTETGTIQTFNFTRRFCLPEDVNPDDITAVISSEGILIITIIRRKTVKVIQQKKDTTDVKETDTKKDETQLTKTTTTTTKTTKTVTITTTKSSFFKETTFVEDVKDFQEAITTIIKKLNLTITEDVFATYRNYRKNNPPKNENQAVSEKETDTTKKIVVDVSDFLENVTVKVVERELVVEGQGKRPTETGTIQTFNFTRRFCLPEDVNPDDITAVISSEGILIITIIRRKTVKVIQQKKDTTDVKETDTKKDETQLTKTTTTTTKTVTITTTKSSFFKETTFVEEVKDFQEAITTIIKKLNLTVTKDVFTTYRNYRKNNPPKNENQAVSEKETDTTKKIVVDVSDFLENVTVKVVEGELVVEGQGKRPTETGTIQTFSFNRHFCLPEDVNPDDITAVISSEGILIITIIRRKTVKVTKVKDTTEKDEAQQTKTTTTTTKTTKTVTITTKGPFFSDQTFVEDVKNFEQAITTIIRKFNLKVTEKDAYTTYRNYRKTNPKNENQAVSEKETNKTKKIVIDVSDFTENVTATVEERELVIEGEGKRQTAGGAIQTFSFNRHFCLPEGATTDDVTAVKSSEGILSVTIKKTVTSSLTTTTETSEESTTSGKVIKITVKGPFFSDPAFADSIKEFQSSISTVIKKFSVKVTGTDTFTAYRNYRKENPKNENQAVSVNETERVKKVVMDVCDFVGAVTAKVEGKEVVVSGTGKRQKGGTGPVITFSFGRRFTLYDDTVIDAITAVMSSEGILTLTIPRKQ